MLKGLSCTDTLGVNLREKPFIVSGFTGKSTSVLAIVHLSKLPDSIDNSVLFLDEGSYLVKHNFTLPNFETELIIRSQITVRDSSNTSILYDELN